MGEDQENSRKILADLINHPNAGGVLVRHLNEVDDTANQRMELLTLQMKERQGINEALKVRDQMAWVGTYNNIRNAAEEVVLSELIYN
jgi:altronate dehydratase